MECETKRAVVPLAFIALGAIVGHTLIPESAIKSREYSALAGGAAGGVLGLLFRSRIECAPMALDEESPAELPVEDPAQATSPFNYYSKSAPAKRSASSGSPGRPARPGSVGGAIGSR